MDDQNCLDSPDKSLVDDIKGFEKEITLIFLKIEEKKSRLKIGFGTYSFSLDIQGLSRKDNIITIELKDITTRNIEFRMFVAGQVFEFSIKSEIELSLFNDVYTLIQKDTESKRVHKRFIFPWKKILKQMNQIPKNPNSEKINFWLKSDQIFQKILKYDSVLNRRTSSIISMGSPLSKFASRPDLKDSSLPKLPNFSTYAKFV